MTVGIVDERGVVARPVVTVAWPTIVRRACCQCGIVENLDFLLAFRLERNMGRYDGILMHNSEVGVLAIIEASRLAFLHVIRIAERSESKNIESLRVFIVAHVECCVRDHIETSCGAGERINAFDDTRSIRQGYASIAVTHFQSVHPFAIHLLPSGHILSEVDGAIGLRLGNQADYPGYIA